MISMLCRLFYVGILAIIFLYFFIKVVIQIDKIKNEKIKNICLVSVIGNYTVNKKRVNVALIRTEFIPKMEENGFTELAAQYRQIASKAVNPDGTISLGKKKKKIKPLVDFFIAPFKFIWKYGSMPYKFVDDAIKSIFSNQVL